ncbi:MAG: biotin/lipoyl-containing protein, partial [Marmoricola sp.]
MSEYLLPDVGEGLVEAEIVTWKVKVGDEVKINDVVVEIETAKSLVELPSPYAGVVEALMVAEGETVAVGTPIIRIGDALRDGRSPTSSGSADPIDLSNPAASGGGEGESLVGRNKAERAPVRRARRTLPEAAGVHAAKADVHDVYNLGAPQQHDRVMELVDAVAADAPEESVPVVPARTVASTQALAKPPVRKLAKDLGVDLGSCAASGPGGVITREDVEAAAGSSPSSPVAAAQAAGTPRNAATSAADREYREPIKGVRKMMGQAMVASAFTAPHVTEWVTLD